MVNSFDYQPLGDDQKAAIEKAFGSSSPSAASASPKYGQDYSSLQDALAQYDAQDQNSGPPTPKPKQAGWQKALGSVMSVVAPAIKYSSLAEDVPVVLRAFGADHAASRYNDALDYIPGVRAAADIATNPWTYAPIPVPMLGELGAGFGAEGIMKGAALAAGSGLGEFAVAPRSERGMGVHIPIVPDKYQSLAGNLLGGAAGAGAMGHVLTEGLPFTESANPELRDLGKGAGALKKEVARNYDKLEAAVAKNGLKPDTMMYSNDGWQTASVKPPPRIDASQRLLRISDLAPVTPDVAAGDYTYLSVTPEEAQKIATSGLPKGFSEGLTAAPEPGTTAIRVPNVIVAESKDGALSLKTAADAKSITTLTTDGQWRGLDGLTVSEQPWVKAPMSETHGNWALDKKSRRWINASTEEAPAVAAPAVAAPEAAAAATPAPTEEPVPSALARVVDGHEQNPVTPENIVGGGTPPAAAFTTEPTNHLVSDAAYIALTEKNAPQDIAKLHAIVDELHTRAAAGDEVAQEGLKTSWATGREIRPDEMTGMPNAKLDSEWQVASEIEDSDRMRFIEDAMLRRANAGDKEALKLHQSMVASRGEMEGEALPLSDYERGRGSVQQTRGWTPPALPEDRSSFEAGASAPPHPSFLPENMTPQQAQKLIDSGMLSESERKVAQQWIDGAAPRALARSTDAGMTPEGLDRLAADTGLTQHPGDALHEQTAALRESVANHPLIVQLHDEVHQAFADGTPVVLDSTYKEAGTNPAAWQQLVADQNTSAYARPIQQTLGKAAADAGEALQKSIPTTHPLQERVVLSAGGDQTLGFTMGDSGGILVEPLANYEYVRRALFGAARGSVPPEQLLQAYATELAKTVWHEQVHSVVTHVGTTPAEDVLFESAFNRVLDENHELFQKSVGDVYATLKELDSTGALGELKQHAGQRNALIRAGGSGPPPVFDGTGRDSLGAAGESTDAAGTELGTGVGARESAVRSARSSSGDAVDVVGRDGAAVQPDVEGAGGSSAAAPADDVSEVRGGSERGNDSPEAGAGGRTEVSPLTRTAVRTPLGRTIDDGASRPVNPPVDESVAAISSADNVSTLKSAVYNTEADAPKAAPVGVLAKTQELKQVARATTATDITAKPSSSGLLIERGQPISDTTTQLFKDNNGRKAADFVSRGRVGKFIADKLGGLAAIAKSLIDQHIVGYFAKTEAESTNLTQALSNLSRRPFDMFESGGFRDLTKVTNWRGEEVVAPLHDVLQMPENFKLNPAQQQWVDTYHSITQQLVNNAKASGIDIKDLGLEQRGQYYVPRRVLGVMDIDKPGNYGKAAFGTKQPFQQQRYYATAADGIANGVRYSDSLDALALFGGKMQKAARDKELAGLIKQYGRTGKELAGPEVKAARDAEAMKLREAHTSAMRANKALSDENTKYITNTTAAKTGGMSPADIRDAVENHHTVVDAQSERDAAQSALEKAQAKFNGMKTDKGKLSWETKVKDAVDELNAKTDALAQTRKDARASIIEIASGQKDFRIDSAEGNLSTAQANAKEAADTLAQARTSARNTHISTSQVIKGQMKMLRGDLGDFTSQQADVIAAQNELRAAKMMRGDDAAKAARVEAAQTNLDAANKARAEVDPNAALDMSGDIVPVRQVANLPGLQGRLFPAEMADHLEKYLSSESNNALTALGKINDTARTFRASTDFGHMLIQGLPVLARDPVAWAKATVTAVRSFANPEVLQQLYRDNADIIAKWGLYFGKLSSNEYYTAVGREGLIGQLGASDMLLVSGLGKALGRFSVSFDGFLDASRIELAKAFDREGQSPQELEGLGRLIRNMTGTTSTGRLGISQGQKQLEGLLMFSPRFTRSVWALGAQALEAGAGGAQARRTIEHLIGGGALLYTAAYMATNNGELPSIENFNPASGGKFMSVKVGDNYIGIGGTMRGALQFLGYSLQAAQDPSRFLSLDSTSNAHSNPFLKYARSRTSPLAGSLWDAVSGSSVIGEDTHGFGNWLVQQPNNMLPFALSSWTEANGGWHQKLGVLAAQTAGLRTFPEAINQSMNDQMTSYLGDMKDIPGFSAQDLQGVHIWNDLSSYQKQEMLHQHPDLLQALSQQERERWSLYDKIRMETAATKEALGKRLLAGNQALADGQKLSGDMLTAKAYRDMLNQVDTMRRGALNTASGGNTFSGAGSNAIAVSPGSYRNKLMAQYHAAIDAANPVDPTTGELDFTAMDAAEQSFLNSVSPGDRVIIAQEQGASTDPVERLFKAAKVSLRDYWNLNDTTAQRLGFANAQAVADDGTVGQQKRYAALKSKAQDLFRRQNPETDSLLVDWGYASTSIFHRKTTPSSASKLSPVRYVTRKVA